jgi:hypothetical protein
MVLYFQRQVLRRYLETPGYSAGFLTRRWGTAVNPRKHSVDIGLNSQGLITAFAADVLALGEAEQSYWSAHSVPVYGEVCQDWYRTRMMLNPSNVPNVVALIDKKRAALSAALTEITGTVAYGDARPDEQKLDAITIGPLVDSPAAFSDLAMTLCQIAVDPLRDEAVKAAFPAGHRPREGKSLVLLEHLLEARCGLTQDGAKGVVQPLRTLAWLRQEAAHVGVEAFEEAVKELGFTDPPDFLWKAWDVLVDATAKALNDIALHLRATIPAKTES